MTVVNENSAAGKQFQSVTPMSSAGAGDDRWREAVTRQRDQHRSEPSPETPAANLVSRMESGVSVIRRLGEAPPRTLRGKSISRSSPMSSSVRAMLESREFGRRYDSFEADLSDIPDLLPQLECPSGPVSFLASHDSLETLSHSTDILLQHQKRLLSPTLNSRQKRRHVLVLGAGPGGLMAAVQLRLRDHEVVICEQREEYTRNRFIGVYKEVAHLMASLGMPESMTYDFTHYRGKRGIMLADIQTFLHAVALKLGVVIYTGSVASELSLEAVQSGTLKLQRAKKASTATQESSAVGLLRWQYDSVARVRTLV